MLNQWLSYLELKVENLAYINNTNKRIHLQVFTRTYVFFVTCV